MKKATVLDQHKCSLTVATHIVGLSPITDCAVVTMVRFTFGWKDYAPGNYHALMTLSTGEFMRRFLLHVLPRGFQRLRQFGLLANRHRHCKLQRCCALLNAQSAPGSTTPLPSLLCVAPLPVLQRCPVCQTGTMEHLAQLAPTTNVVGALSPAAPLTLFLKQLRF
jgi:hypothetical protein